MKTLLIIGGTSGIGRGVAKLLEKKYYCKIVGSKDLDLLDYGEIANNLNQLGDYDYVLFLSNYNYNAPFHKYSNNFIELEKQLDVNIKGSLYLTSKIITYFRTKGRGKLIFTSSVTVNRKVFGTSIYSLAKAAFEDLTVNLSLENANKGITVNAISLGYMDAGLTYRLTKEQRGNILKEIPLGRFGTLSEISRTVTYILDTDYLTGSIIKLHGGL